MEESTSSVIDEPSPDKTQNVQEVHGDGNNVASAIPIPGLHSDTFEGNKLVRSINCPYCITFSTVYPYSFERHIKNCKEIPEQVRALVLRPEDGGVHDNDHHNTSSPINNNMDQVSPLNSEIVQQQQQQSQSPTFHTLENIDHEVRVISTPIQHDNRVSVITTFVEESEGTAAPGQKRRKRKMASLPPSELYGSEVETANQLNRPNVSLLITSHCTKCPLCNFTTKYHFNIARHLYCKHKEDYTLLSEGKKSLDGIRLKDPGNFRRAPPKPFQPRRSKNDLLNGPHRKRGRPRILEDDTGSGNPGFPPLLLQQQQIVDETGHELHQFDQDVPLPVLDRYCSDMDISADFLNQLSEPGSSILQTALEWDNYLHPLNQQQQQQQQAGPSSILMNMTDYMEANNNDMNLSIPNDGTDHALLQNAFTPSLSSSSSSSSTLPPISIFKNFPSILSQRLQQDDVEQQLQQNEGRLMSPEQVEIRKREAREKARERRRLDKLIPETVPDVNNGPVGHESSFGQFSNFFPPISVPGTRTDSASRLVAGESQSLPESQDDNPQAHSSGSRIRRPSYKVKDQSLSKEEQERMKKEKLREWRKNNYLKKKRLEQEKIIRELESMDPETRAIHEKKLEKWRRNYERKKERERLRKEQMNHSESTFNGNDSALVHQNDREASTFRTHSVSQSGEPQLDDEAKMRRKMEKDKQYRKNYYAMRKKRQSEEIEQRRQQLLEEIQHKPPDDHSYFVPTSSGTDYSMYQPPGERKKRKNKKIVENNVTDQSWHDQNRGEVTKMTDDDDDSLDGEPQQKKQRDDNSFDHVFDDSDWVEDDDYSDADLTTDVSDNEASTGPKEQITFIDTGPKLHRCKLCEFSTPHGFNLLIHTKIHEIIDILPEFFLGLLKAGGNLERLLSEEPDVSRAKRYFMESGFDAAPILEVNCHESVATVS